MCFEQRLDRYRPVPFYFLTATEPEAYTEQAVFSAMTDCKNAGFGGIVLFNKPPLGFDAEGYLSDAWFELTGRFIKAARQLDLQLWINDGFNYPPGDAAGRIEAAAPYLKQLRLHPNPDGRLDVAEVPWGFPAFEEPESSALFIKFVYEEYYKRFAPFFGNGITGFFSDADNRRVNSTTRRLLDGERYYPWSRNFPEIFKVRFGFDITEHLKELFSESDPDIVEKYWRFCGELYQQWFANNHQWCVAHNALYTFHTSDTGPLGFADCFRSSAFTEGDPLALLSHSEMPGTDHELLVLDGGTHYDGRLFSPEVSFGKPPEKLAHPAFGDTSRDVRAKYASSAAVLNGKKRVMCEMFAATNWGATFNDLRRIAAWQIMQGVNFIVPHAVHHRFRGEVKHFAPPEFLNSTLRHGLRQFNDMLAACCRAAAEGEYLADYAVIDPTREVWNGADSSTFFRFCDTLARRAEGYVIVPGNYAGPIKNIIDPLNGIPELPPPSIYFTGGELAFMRRKIDGEEYLLAANVWSPDTLSGTLVFRERRIELELEPGEIAVVGGPFEFFRSPEKRRVRQTFSEPCAVTWEDGQFVPFEKTLRFTAKKDMTMQLLIPADNQGKVTVNGHSCVFSEAIEVFDDHYLTARISVPKGDCAIELETAAEFTSPALVGGDIEVEITTRGDYTRKVHQQYMLAFFEPEEMHLTIAPRRKRIVPGKPWEQQGQIFYSGAAVLELGEAETEADSRLELPGFNGIAELIVDGKAVRKCSLSPYRFPLEPGRHHLALRLWNTLANRMERYAAPSGLKQPPEITVPEKD